MPFIAVAVAGSLIGSLITTGVLFSVTSLALAASTGGIAYANKGSN